MNLNNVYRNVAPATCSCLLILARHSHKHNTTHATRVHSLPSYGRK